MNWPLIAKELWDSYEKLLRTDVERALRTLAVWTKVIAHIKKAQVANEPDDWDTNPFDEREVRERRQAEQDQFCLDQRGRDRAGRQR